MKSESVGLIVRAISFQDFEHMWSQSTNVTDRQTTCDHNTALCTVVQCTVMMMMMMMMIIIIIIPGQCFWCCHHDSESLREFTQFTWWMRARWLPTFGPSQRTWAIGPPV